jgi:GNAT superfamily N-acetyltransferase
VIDRSRLRLKTAAAGDAARLARIHTTARAAAMPWLPVLHSLEETESWIASVVLPQQDVWLAAVDDEVVGFVALSTGWVEQLYIDPAAWRAGLGSALLDLAKQPQPSGFQLWTFQQNGMARNFYRKHGLVEIRLTDGHENEEKQPDVLLEWSPAT